MSYGNGNKYKLKAHHSIHFIIINNSNPIFSKSGKSSGWAFPWLFFPNLMEGSADERLDFGKMGFGYFSFFVFYFLFFLVSRMVSPFGSWERRKTDFRVLVGWRVFPCPAFFGFIDSWMMMYFEIWKFVRFY